MQPGKSVVSCAQSDISVYNVFNKRGAFCKMLKDMERTGIFFNNSEMNFAHANDLVHVVAP